MGCCGSRKSCWNYWYDGTSVDPGVLNSGDGDGHCQGGYGGGGDGGGGDSGGCGSGD